MTITSTETPVRPAGTPNWAVLMTVAWAVLSPVPRDEARAAAPAQRPQWIWASPNRAPERTFCFRRTVTIDGPLKRAELQAVVESCRAAFFINGRRQAVREPFGPPLQLDVTEALRQGENTLGVCCRGEDGPAAAAVRLLMEFADGRAETILSDSGWQAAPVEAGDRASHLKWPDPDRQHWRPAMIFGRVGLAMWGGLDRPLAISPLDDYTQWKQAQGAPAGTDPASFQAPSGFEVELLRSARDGEGSWVGMTFDPQGRLVVAREERGLLRMTLPQDRTEGIRVEVIDDSLHECRGLLFAHGSLYAMANNDRGLYRLRDADGDDRFERVERLATFEGEVGHGRNQLALGPDGRIYVICGDAVFEPKTARSPIPELAHPNRHERTRSGFVARTDRDGRRWEVLARGLRNPFGLAFHPDGELFTYDADAEYDTGAPWYRPTRIVHIVPGGDCGWRRVTRQWPPYDPDRPDMPPPTLDIGKGSPTAVAFGTSSRFPPQYRTALFALDWAYGRILAVHLAPRGSSYAASAEVFLRGRPLNVTDLEFGPDGMMYFVTGGRGTQSALYRVRYTGPEIAQPPVTIQETARRRHAEPMRRLRRRLEGLHGRGEAESIGTAWPHLGASDPWVRHAARAAVEWQPLDRWKEKTLSEPDPERAVTALLAMVRIGPAEIHPDVAARLSTFDLASFPAERKLAALFIYERCLGEGSLLTPQQRRAVLERIDPLYPDEESFEVNRRLSRLLAQLEADRFVARTVPLLEEAQQQEQRLHYLFVLRNARTGWTRERRKIYFEHLRRTAEFVGGEGMPTFRRLIESEALANVPEAERGPYEARLRKSDAAVWQAEVPDEKREFVREWKVTDFADSLGDLDGRDLERGRRMFAVGRCIVCHRIEGRGGVLGPDLSSVSGRFSPRDLLTAIVEPSRVVPENYHTDLFVLSDGRVITGRIMAGGDYRSPDLRVMTDPLDPDRTVTFKKQDIRQRKPSPVSPMPKGLLNTLTRDEILDLIAYVRAAGGGVRPASGGRPPNDTPSVGR